MILRLNSLVLYVYHLNIRMGSYFLPIWFISVSYVLDAFISAFSIGHDGYNTITWLVIVFTWVFEVLYAPR